MVNSAPSSNLPAGTPAPRSPSFLSPSSSSNRTDLLQRLSHIIISRACCSSAPRGGRSSLACQRGLGGYPAAPFRHRGRTTRVARRWHVGGAAVCPTGASCTMCPLLLLGAVGLGAFGRQLRRARRAVAAARSAHGLRAFSPPSFGRRPWRVFAAREPASPAATGKFRATRVGEASLSTLAPGKPWAAPAAAPLPRRLTHSLCQQRIHPSARRPAPLPDRRRCFRSSSRCAFSAPLGSWWAP